MSDKNILLEKTKAFPLKYLKLRKEKEGGKEVKGFREDEMT